MLNDLLLVRQFIAELVTRDYQYERVPEPELVMSGADSVREFRDAGRVDGSVAPVYLFNMLVLSGNIRPGAVVVDLGCGPANLLIELALLHPQTRFIGVDLSGAMLNLAAELRDSVSATNVAFLHGDITSITGIAPGTADLVMSTLTLHHLPQRPMLADTVLQAMRLLQPGGHLHLMDFGGLKRRSTTDYFASERVGGLTPFLAADYRNSLYAAYRAEDLEALLPLARSADPGASLRTTYGVPFLMALTSLQGRPLTDARQCGHLWRYWQAMKPAQRKDFEAIRYFFRLGGLRAPHPRQFARD